MGQPYWPLFELRVRTPRLELRPPDEADVFALAALAVEGIHDPATMPFLTEWSVLPSPARERSVLQWHWKAWADWSAAKWDLPLAVVVDGEVVGTQAVHAEQFPVLRSVYSGSWLVRRWQGKGIGTEMRAAMLHLAFAWVGAEVAFSGAYPDNEASVRISRSLGYEDDGWEPHVRQGAAARSIRFRLERARWEERRRHDIAVEGLDACRDMFGH